MTTSFLLHGGRLKLKDKRNDSYFKRLSRDMKDGDILLHIPFARLTDEEQDDVFEREKEWILAQASASITVIKADKKILPQQLLEAKVVHITGGYTTKLIDYVKDIPDFMKLLSGKTIGGSSAGACLFSSKYWFGEESRTCEGLGTLPLALFVHYGSKEFNATEDKLTEFMSQAKGLTLVKLEEAEWIEYSLNI